MRARQSGEKKDNFICDFNGTLVHKNNVVEIRTMKRPNRICRVCSLIKDISVMWPNECSEPVLLVADFAGAFHAITPDEMVRNFGYDYLDGYDGCLTDSELEKFKEWKRG